MLNKIAARRPVPARIAYPQDDAAYHAAVQIGIDQLDAGLAIPIEKVWAWVRSWETDKELPPPGPGCA